MSELEAGTRPKRAFSSPEQPGTAHIQEIDTSDTSPAASQTEPAPFSCPGCGIELPWDYHSQTCGRCARGLSYGFLVLPSDQSEPGPSSPAPSGMPGCCVCGGGRCHFSAPRGGRLGAPLSGRRLGCLRGPE